MHQGSRLKGVSGVFPGHVMLGQAAQFVIDQRQKLAGGLGIALIEGI
jgi:hypothetical protein